MTSYRRLLLAFDGSDGSEIAAVHAAILSKRLRADLYAVWVRGRLPHYPETIDEIDEEEESAHEFFDRLKERLEMIARDNGIVIRSQMRAGNPARIIVELAHELASDLVIVGSRGHSRLWGSFLGHTADRLSEHAPCSVLIVRSSEASAQFRKMLVGYDGSQGAEIALRYALQLAKQLGSEVQILWIHDSHSRLGDKSPGSLEDDWAEQHFKSILEPRMRAAAALAEVSVQCGFKVGNAAQLIISEAHSGRFRIVALGHRGASGIWGRFLGGVADRVSDRVNCDVLIIRERE
jgi:nucleotide-binding universal stress UspA family protein